MKVNKLLAGALCALSILPACTTEEAGQSDVAELAPREIHVYHRIPLSSIEFSVEEGHLNAGEVLDRSATPLVPVLNEILSQLDASKIQAHSEDYDVPNPAGGQLYQKVLANFDNWGIQFRQQQLTQAIEVIYEGDVRGTQVSLEPAWLRFVWIDPEKQFPDKNMFRVSMDDVGDMPVQGPQGRTTLRKYLAAGHLPHYLLRVQDVALGQDYRARTLEDADTVEEMLANGELDAVLEFNVEKYQLPAPTPDVVE